MEISLTWLEVVAHRAGQQVDIYRPLPHFSMPLPLRFLPFPLFLASCRLRSDMTDRTPTHPAAPPPLGNPFSPFRHGPLATLHFLSAHTHTQKQKTRPAGGLSVARGALEELSQNPSKSNLAQLCGVLVLTDINADLCRIGWLISDQLVLCKSCLS